MQNHTDTETQAQSSGAADCSTELIPLWHPSADQWESKALVFPVSLWARPSHPAGSERLRNQWLHTDTAIMWLVGEVTVPSPDCLFFCCCLFEICTVQFSYNPQEKHKVKNAVHLEMWALVKLVTSGLHGNVPPLYPYGWPTWSN